MAYVYCNKCKWEQDDFWELRFKPQWKFWYVRSILGYNPISCFLADVVSYAKPRWIHFDSNFFTENNIPKRRRHLWGAVYSQTNEIHSWTMIKRSWIRNRRKWKTMHWVTEQEWREDPKRDECPKCGHKLGVD